MIDETKLRAFMIAQINLLKVLDEDHLALSTEVAALKGILQKLSGQKFLPLYEQERAATRL